MNLNIEESVPIEIRFEHDLINPITESVLLNSNLESINFEKPNFIDESVHIKLHAPEKLKIIVVGDHGVGKTSLIYRFKYDLFDPFAKSPNGYEVTLKDFQLHEKNYSLQFWDYNLEEKYEKIIKAFYRDANIILFCFDLSNLISFENIENYIEIAKSYINSNCSAFLIGTKKDVLPLIVSKEEIEKICAKEKIPFFELSARIDGDCDEFLRKVIRSN